MLIRVRELEKIYAMGETEVRALAGVSADIAAGEFIAVMGPSGSGKSTFMNLLGCLDRPARGEYWLAGERVSELAPDRLAQVRRWEAAAAMGWSEASVLVFQVIVLTFVLTSDSFATNLWYLKWKHKRLRRHLKLVTDDDNQFPLSRYGLTSSPAAGPRSPAAPACRRSPASESACCA